MSRTSTALTALAQLRCADVTSRALELARAEQDLEQVRQALLTAERSLSSQRAETDAFVAAETARLEAGEAEASDWASRERYRVAAQVRTEELRQLRDEAGRRVLAAEGAVRRAQRALAEAHGKKEAVERCLGAEVRLASGRAERARDEEAVEGALARWSSRRPA